MKIDWVRMQDFGTLKGYESWSLFNNIIKENNLWLLIEHPTTWSILIKQQQKNTPEFGQVARFYQFTEK